MELDPELLKKLLETFKPELEEKLQAITDNTLVIEKTSPTDSRQQKAIEAIFRAAHNIKGTARGVGIADVGNIAHHLETLFVGIQNGSTPLSPTIINLSLEAVDKIRQAMTAFVAKTPVDFNLDEFCKRLQLGESAAPIESHQQPIEPAHTTDIIDADSIRVSVDNLDRISALMEDFLINKIAIDDHYRGLTQLTTNISTTQHDLKQFLRQHQSESLDETTRKALLFTKNDLSDITHTAAQLKQTMHAHINQINLLSNTLSEEVRMLRLIPASVLLRTLPRTVRDIAQELHKPVNFTIEGDSVKMDKLVLEGLKDPLIHILRNAIDHGIEDQATRQAQHKPETANIHIQVVDEGNHITIHIRDDGAGIDLNKVSKKALASHLVTTSEHQKMSRDDILELIFKPGFSTKDIITDVSGRGIGLDVVKENITNLKGQVRISTESGKGTTISLSVPLTLASEHGLLIKSGGQLFVVPNTLIEHVVNISLDDIIQVETNQAVLINQHPIPLRMLSDLLELSPSTTSTTRLPVLVTKKGKDCIGFVVDEIMGEREIIIKPLLAPLSSVTCIAGGTLSGDGQVILVLNMNQLLHDAIHKTSNITRQQPTSTSKTTARPHILVVDDSITTRTLEKNILESKDYLVTTAVNGKEAWDLLQKQSYSLLITDVSMPIMDGFTLTQHVKQHPTLRETPVIIVTSLNSDAEKKRGIDVGADAYIVKNTFESTELLNIVAQLI